MYFGYNSRNNRSEEEILREKDEEQERDIQDQIDKGIILDYKKLQKDHDLLNGHNKNKYNNFIDENVIQSEIQTNDYIEYVIKQVKKTVKCEDVLIRQILYTGLSSYIGDDPINLGIIAPTSEGKTYPVEECIKYFPKEDVEKVGSMSAKVLVRKRGILVNKNLEPIGDKLRELNRLKNSTKDSNLKMDLMEEIDRLHEGAKTLIDLRGKILVFLEPPQREVWDILKPILSHDSPEIEYPFVNKTDREGHETKDVVVRGWPSCIFCSAKDESHWSIWPEIKSRCLITSPNMIPQKYKQSTKLISSRYGKPNSTQQKIIISDNEIELTKKCVLFLKQKINELRSKNHDGKISYWIPYATLLETELPSNKGTDVRFQKREFAFLRTISVLRFHLRKSLVLEGNETSIIPDLKDLKEVLSIIQNFDGIPRQKMEFFNDVFYPLYKSKSEPNSNEDESKKEEIKAVTAKELCDFYKQKKGKIINTDNLKKTFLNELENNGLIDHEISNIHRSQYIYYPLVEPTNNNESTSLTSNLSQFDQISQYSSKIYENITTKFTEIPLFYEIMQVYPRRIEMEEIIRTNTLLEDYLNNHENELKILDENHNKLTISRFIQNYLNLNLYLNVKPSSQFDDKKSPNTTPFDKTSPLTSKLGKFDVKDVKDENEKGSDFITTNHFDKVAKETEKEEPTREREGI